MPAFRNVSSVIFYKKPNDEGVYITTIDEYKQKIEQLLKLGGNQLLLQGGLHPKLGLSFYADLFKQLKSFYPKLKTSRFGTTRNSSFSKTGKEIVYLYS
ncbi:MAG: hypothetical protein MZV63_19255 [Marinilabiliales bacterium]|nr:hypothetical protein [Marinilabiliales bacterium]